MTLEVSELKQQLETSRQQLQLANYTLRDITNEKFLIQTQRDICCNKITKSKQIQSHLEEELASLHIQNIDLSMAFSDLENELLHESSIDVCTSDENFSFQTKSGRRYSPSIRKLYYTLLTNQVPTTKISSIIKTVIKCFNPAIDIEHLKPPQRSCANYMRGEEM